MPMQGFKGGVIILQGDDSSKLVAMLQSLQGPLSGVLSAYSTMLQNQGAPPDLEIANITGSMGQAIAQAQKVQADMAQLQAQLATAQAREAPVKTSFPPIGGQQQQQQGNQQLQGYSGGTVAGAGIGGAAVGFIAGMLLGRKKR